MLHPTPPTGPGAPLRGTGRRRWLRHPGLLPDGTTDRIERAAAGQLWRLVGGVLLRTLRETSNVSINLAPRDGRYNPTLMGGFDEGRIVEGARFDVHVVWMLRGGREDGRATLWTEVTGEFTTTLATLRKPFRAAAGDLKFRDMEANTNIERATGAPPTVLAVAVACRAN